MPLVLVLARAEYAESAWWLYGQYVTMPCLGVMPAFQGQVALGLDALHLLSSGARVHVLLAAPTRATGRDTYTACFYSNASNLLSMYAAALRRFCFIGSYIIGTYTGLS